MRFFQVENAPKNKRKQLMRIAIMKNRNYSIFSVSSSKSGILKGQIK